MKVLRRLQEAKISDERESLVLIMAGTSLMLTLMVTLEGRWHLLPTRLVLLVPLAGYFIVLVARRGMLESQRDRLALRDNALILSALSLCTLAIGLSEPMIRFGMVWIWLPISAVLGYGAIYNLRKLRSFFRSRS